MIEEKKGDEPSANLGLKAEPPPKNEKNGEHPPEIVKEVPSEITAIQKSQSQKNSEAEKVIGKEKELPEEEIKKIE